MGGSARAISLRRQQATGAVRRGHPRARTRVRAGAFAGPGPAHLSVQSTSTRRGCSRCLAVAEGGHPGEVGLSSTESLGKQGPPGECLLKLVTCTWAGVRDPVRHGDSNLVADSPASRRLRLFRVPDKTVLASRFLQVSLVFRVYKTAPTACACRRSGAPAP